MSDDEQVLIFPVIAYHQVPPSVWIFELNSENVSPTTHAFGFFYLFMSTFVLSCLFCILRQGCVGPDTAVAVPLLQGDRVVSSKVLDSEA